MNVPEIVKKGGEWFTKLGIGKSGGTRIVCVSGHVEKPGVYELPMGIPFRELIYDVCGGIPNGRKLKGVIPGGSSMPPLDASELDVACEFDALMTDARIKDVEVRPGVPFDLGGGRKLKTMAGSGGIVVIDDSTDVVALCARIMKFYAHESCGQCTPCREGTGWLARVCKRLARGEGAGRRRRAPGQHRQRHRRQHDLRARRRGGLADAGLPHQVPRRLRGAHQAEDDRHPGGGQGRGGVSSLAPDGVSTGDAVVFWLLAAMIVWFALFTITRKNPVTAVMSLVATFFGLAAIYATLSAHFLAVLQVLVYAGAIMVLFIFVVMILNREEVTPLSFRLTRVLGVAGRRLPVREVRRRRRASGRPAASRPPVGDLRHRRRGRRSAVPRLPLPVRGDLGPVAGRHRRRRGRSPARTRKRSPPTPRRRRTASRSTSWPATTTRAPPSAPAPEGHH